MGLPLFITPVEPEEVAKITDKTAARSRSAIRRQRTVRRPNHQLRPEGRRVRTPFEGSSTPILPDHAPDFTDTVSPTEEVELEAIRARVAAGRRLRETIRGLPPTHLLTRGDPHRVSRSSRGRPSSSPRQRLEGPPTPQAAASVVPRMPPVPESGDFQDSRRSFLSAWRGGDRAWAENRRDNQNSQLESHLTFSFSRRETSAILANASGTELPALTPNFSPARRFTLEESRDRPHSDNPLTSAYYPSYSADIEQASSLSRVRSPSRELRSLPDLVPLRRMTWRRVADIEARRRGVHPARLDGLGDRDRSLSPDGDSAWETMLTTLTPDPQLPSAGSSFASVSAATSASSSADSSGTSLTTMGSTRQTDTTNNAIDNVCDVEDSQDSSILSDTDAEDEDDPYELGDEARDRFWRSYADVVASRADRVARYHGAADSDNLGGMQRIVRRLARREDIPDEWWAEAGLSRNFPRETIQL